MTQEHPSDNPMDLLGDEDAQLARLNAMHRSLRGRYPLAILLAIVGLVGGVLLGYGIPTPVYMSTAQIRIAPVVPKVLYGDEEKRMLPRFEAFIETQVEMIRNQRVLGKAVQDPAWQQLGLGADAQAVAAIAKAVKVDHPFKTETISIQAYHRDPKIAQVTANVVANAYLEQAKSLDVSAEIKKLQILEQRRVELSNQLQTIQRSISASNQVGAESLVQLHASKMTRVEKLEAELDEVQMAIYTATEAMSRGGDAVSPESVASVDLQMRTYVHQRDLVSREIDRLKAKFGDEHRAVREQVNILAGVNDLIDIYMKDVASTASDGGISVELVRLRSRERALQAKVKNARQEADVVGREEMALANLHDEEEVVRQKLSDVTVRVEQLNLESAFSGRASLLSDGDLPVTPAIDHRNKVAAALGVFGMTIGFGAVLLVGVADPRIRSVGDARAAIKGAPLLGMMPTMPKDLTDTEQVTNAAHSIHNVRTMMQISSRSDSSSAFVVTSPGPQTGKTSLSMALGLSFAGTGSRTLLIDGDLIGGGLSRRIETLLDDAAITGDNAGRGLMDAVDGRDINECVQPTQVPDLWVLMLDNASESDVTRLSPKVVQQLLANARDRFDTIVIDTGPTPASLEASLLAAQADGVVIVVSRGENQVDGVRAVDHLRSCGANVVGMIFNRADQRDLDASGMASVSRRSIRQHDAAAYGDLDAAGLVNHNRGGAARQSSPVGSAPD